MYRALLLVTGLIFAGAAAAQYKWVDKNGKVQYGDTPPPGVNASALRPPPLLSQPEAAAGTDDAKKAPATFAEKDADLRKRQQEAEKEREKQALAQQEAADKRENCTRAREALRVLESGRVARTDPKGERYYLDEAQLSQEKARALQAVQQWCN